MSEPAEGRIERLLRRGAKEVRPYITGRLASEVEEEYGLTDVVKLASNENPLGPSPKAMRAARKAVGAVERYPDGSARALKKELARMLSLKEEELVIGNGGDDVLSILGRTLINEGDECIIPNPSFAPYETVTRVMGGVPVFSPLKDFAIDLEDIRG
ncbi:MAG: aminotransferase class I/II-fold pyridoxal phosphate-dependent enzyme, partial [Nitrospinota bacterium]